MWMAMECGRRWRGQRKPRQKIMLDKDKCRRTEERKMETGQGQRTGQPPYGCRQPCSGSLLITSHVSLLTSHVALSRSVRP
jgi:hypothetical protein